ncbi:MAG: 2-dehydro-3-deoxygalactonokinase [Anaerolineaceae bacterium]
MNIVTIDCGTTNSRIYVVDSNAHMLYRASIKVGVRDTAISGSNKALKEALRTLFERALQETKLQVSDICCILSSGMISSEIGLLEVPHLWAPCNVDDLAHNLQPYVDPSVFPTSIPVYFIRGIKNAFDPNTICLHDIDSLDFMRGEETQTIGLLEDSKINLPCCIIVLSSHTKFISVDAQRTILGSVTTLSGQLYNAILKETIIGKSLQSEGMEDSDFFDAKIVESAKSEIERSGFLRGLLLVRFLDTLLHTPVRERHLMIESLIAAEDLHALSSVEKLTGQISRNFVLIGQAQRCRVYEYLLCHMPGNSNCSVHCITDPVEIDSLSIRGALTLAKKAGIIENH